MHRAQPNSVSFIPHSIVSTTSYAYECAQDAPTVRPRRAGSSQLIAQWLGHYEQHHGPTLRSGPPVDLTNDVTLRTLRSTTPIKPRIFISSVRPSRSHTSLLGSALLVLFNGLRHEC